MKKIKLACNWSHPLMELLDENAVRLDYIKAWVGRSPDDFDKLLLHKPVLIHGLGYRGHTGMKNLNEVDFNKANALLSKCCCPHYGLHFGIEKKNISGRTDEEIYIFMSEQTQIFKQRLNVPLLLENTPDSITDRTVFDIYSEFQHKYINQFIIDNDVLFLLDLTHAKVSAVYNGWDIRDYCESLPLSRVKEIHVNGSGFDQSGNIKDAPMSMKEEDYELLEWMLNRTNPDIVTLEYSRKEGESYEEVKENLVVQLERLNEIVND